MAALVAATSLSTPVIADVGDTFIGQNGGSRVVDAIQFEGDIANITVTTTNRHGRVKTRTFHVRRDANGVYQADSKGTAEFQQFLINQAQAARAALATPTFTITSANTSIWQLRDMFPDIDIMAYTDGIDMTEEDTVTLYNAGVDLDSFWFIYDVSHIPTRPVLPTFTFSDGFTVTNEGTGVADDPYSLITEYGVNNAYEIVNVEGLEEAHGEGWTGNGVSVIVAEPSPNSDTHDERVAEIVRAVAPASTIEVIDYTNLIDGVGTTDVDVINHSYGRHRNNETGVVRFYDLVSNETGQVINSGIMYFGFTDVDTYAQSTVAGYQNTIAEAPNALHVYSAGNNGNTAADGFVYTSGPTYDSVPGSSYTLYTADYDATFYNTDECVARGGRFTADSCTDNKWLYDAGADMSRTILVGAVDDNNQLTHYSVSAGDRAKNDFIVADGTQVTGWGNGTSFAAPRVSGAAALVIHKFGTSAENTKKIILETADDLGAAGVDSVYGHGKLNVGRALAPVGTLR